MAESTKNKSVNPLLFSIGGMVAGAAVAVFATKAMQDEKTRKTVVKSMNDFKSWGNNALKQVSKRADQIKDDSEKIADDLEDASKTTIEQDRSSRLH